MIIGRTEYTRGRIPRESTRWIVIHRVLWCAQSSSWGKLGVEPTGMGVGDFYAMPIGGKWPKPSMWFPYHFTIAPDGTVEQFYPIGAEAPHGWQINPHSISVALIGDPRIEALPMAQWNALVWLCGGLRDLYPQAKIAGHTAREFRIGKKSLKSTKDPGKKCPGRFVRADHVEAAVVSMRSVNTAIRLEEAGAVF